MKKVWKILIAFAEIILIIIEKELTHFYSIMLLGIVGAFVWEVLGPIINENSVADYIDLLCYICGTIVYYILYNVFANTVKNNQC